MNCPICNCSKTKVLSVRKQGVADRRRRECPSCGYRFATYETLGADYKNIKRPTGSKQVTFFETHKELRQLTGLPTYKELMAAGFHLKDMKFGFVCDTPWDMDGWFDGSSRNAPYFEYWLLSRMDAYSNQCSHIEYGGKHYYMTYHD